MKARKASWTRNLPLLILLISSASFCVFGIGIQPNRIDTIIPYGETDIIEVTVTNPGDDPLQVDVSLMGLEMTQSGEILWLGNDGRDAAGNFYPYANISPHVTIEPTVFTVEPHEETTIHVQVRTPGSRQEEAMAGCVGALWFDVVNAAADSEGSSPFNTVFRLITFVLIQFDGGQHRAAELTTLPVYQDNELDIHFPVLFSNQGNVHVSPSGQVVIRKAESGEIVDVIGLTEGTALPQRPREYEAVWRSSSQRQGRFIAEFSMTYGSDSPDLTASVLITVDAGGGVQEQN